MLFNNHNLNHVSKNHNLNQPKITVGANEWRNEPRLIVDENEEEEEPIRQCACWTREEEILLTECWIETSENGQIPIRGFDARKRRRDAVSRTQNVPETGNAGKRSETPGKRPREKWKRFFSWGSSGGSASGSLSDYVSEDLRLKLQAETSAYEAKKTKEMAMIEFKEMTFLTIDADSLPEPKASIIRNKQEKVIAKYT
ncbi:hypothetical protein Tco_0058674 [Tanacetum coccineum]